MRAVSATFMLLAMFATSAGADTLADAAASLDAMMAALQRDDALDLDGEQVLAVEALPHFYASNGNAPAWTNPATVRTMLQAINDIRDDGLDPTDYHGPALTELGAATPTDAHTLARRDVLLTDALYLMLYHLSFGKADPNRLDQDWNLSDLYDELAFTSTKVQEEVTARLLAAIADGDLDGLFVRARPKLNLYLDLRAGHAFYRELAAAGGWPTMPAGPTLRDGDTDPRVTVLRQRLAMTRDLEGDHHASTTFDADLAAAVTHFQSRHGLDTDGIVGKGTMAALNVPATARVDKIRVNLERSRWVMNHEVGGDLVLVNIAAYETWLVRDRKLLWRSRVQVGKPYTSTPVFADAITYLEINPTWTVPASIANRSILPKVKADPGYLAAEGMVLLDSQGREVSSDTVNWNTVSRMPYTVRQQPGPRNALGRVKFMFPNKHAVYLHDTPSRYKFSQSARAFSSGCIRVQDPFELATLLLDDQPEWSRAHIDEVLESGERTTVRLTEPLPVIILYWTSFVEFDGTIHFQDDLYDRDPPVLAALNGPFELHQRHENREWKQ